MLDQVASGRKVAGVDFWALDPEDPREFMGPAPGKWERLRVGSIHVPEQMGPPRALEVYRVELYDVPAGSAVSPVLVSRQVFPIPSVRSFPRPRP